MSSGAMGRMLHRCDSERLRCPCWLDLLYPVLRCSPGLWLEKLYWIRSFSEIHPLRAASLLDVLLLISSSF